MSGLERRLSSSSRIEREAQAFISALASSEIDGATLESASASTAVARRPAELPMFVIPFDEHPDHQMLPVESGDRVRVRLRLIEHSLVASSPLIRARMGIEDANVSMLEQLGMLDDQPLFVRVSYHLPGDFSRVSRLCRDQGFEADAIPLGEAFKIHFDTELGYSQSSVEAVRSDNRTATSLRVTVGTPMMLREMVLTGVDGVVRELSFTHFRADRVALQDL